VAGDVEANVLSLIVGDKVGTDHEAEGYPGKLKDLKGHKIGIVAHGTTPEFALRYMLEQAGLDPDKDVTIVPVGLPAQALSAMKAGRVDADIAFEPLTTAATDAGIARIMVDLRKGEVPDLAWRYSQWIAPRKAVQADPEKFKRLKAAVEETYTWMKDPANRDELVAMTTKSVAGGDAKLAASLLDNNLEYFGAEVQPEDVEKAAAFLKAAGVSKKPVDPQDYFEDASQ